MRLVRNESLVNLALSLLSTGKPAEAVGCLDRVCAEEPGNLRYGLVRTHGLLRSGRHGEALEWIEGAFRQGAGGVELELMLCGALLGLGRGRESEERIRRLTGEHPGCAAAWQVLGQLLASRGEDSGWWPRHQMVRVQIMGASGQREGARTLARSIRLEGVRSEVRALVEPWL